MTYILPYTVGLAERLDKKIENPRAFKSKFKMDAEFRILAVNELAF